MRIRWILTQVILIYLKINAPEVADAGIDVNVENKAEDKKKSKKRKKSKKSE